MSSQPLAGVGAVLIVDDCRVTRLFMERMLGAHVRRVLPAEDFAGAHALLVSDAALDLVIADVNLPDRSGFDLIEAARRPTGETIPVALVTGTPRDGDAKRAATEGAVGYFRKPLSVVELARALHAKPSLRHRRSAVRYRRGRTARLLEHGGGESLIEGQIHDLSVDGAFVSTEGPIPVGSEVDLQLTVGKHRVVVRATVLRVDEPSWLRPGGVALRFADVAGRKLDALRAILDEMEEEPA